MKPETERPTGLHSTDHRQVTSTEIRHGGCTCDPKPKTGQPRRERVAKKALQHAERHLRHKFFGIYASHIDDGVQTAALEFITQFDDDLSPDAEERLLRRFGQIAYWRVLDIRKQKWPRSEDILDPPQNEDDGPSLGVFYSQLDPWEQSLLEMMYDRKTDLEIAKQLLDRESSGERGSRRVVTDADRQRARRLRCRLADKFLQWYLSEVAAK